MGLAIAGGWSALLTVLFALFVLAPLQAGAFPLPSASHLVDRSAKAISTSSHVALNHLLNKRKGKSSKGKSKKLSKGAIAGIVIAIIVILIIVAVIFFLRRRRAASQRSIKAQPVENQNGNLETGYRPS
ncbi:MAG: hypothetical protein M4579_000140 [Chaenotheca gracillima]|nr:MAG: hypothetical protein M4579_000140 [Chaenotheca gracillima]